MAFQPVVLTYPVSGFPFELQQNPNPASTNWTPVEPVIYSGTNVNNQVFFVLPATASRMFYRLQLQPSN